MLDENSKVDSLTWIDVSSCKPTELQMSRNVSFVKYMQKQIFLRIM